MLNARRGSPEKKSVSPRYLTSVTVQQSSETQHTFSRYCRRSATASLSLSAKTGSYSPSRDLPVWNRKLVFFPFVKAAHTTATRRSASTHLQSSVPQDRTARLGVYSRFFEMKVELRWTKQIESCETSTGNEMSRKEWSKCSELERADCLLRDVVAVRCSQRRA